MPSNPALRLARIIQTWHGKTFGSDPVTEMAEVIDEVMGTDQTPLSIEFLQACGMEHFDIHGTDRYFHPRSGFSVQDLSGKWIIWSGHFFIGYITTRADYCDFFRSLGIVEVLPK